MVLGGGLVRVSGLARPPTPHSKRTGEQTARPKKEAEPCLGPALHSDLEGKLFVPDFAGAKWAAPDDGCVIAVLQVPRLDVFDFEAAGSEAAGVMARKFCRGAKGLHVCSPDLDQRDC